MTKTELRQLSLHELVGRIVDLERLQDETSAALSQQRDPNRRNALVVRSQVIGDNLAAANAVHKMRLRLDTVARRSR